MTAIRYVHVCIPQKYTYFDIFTYAYNRCAEIYYEANEQKAKCSQVKYIYIYMTHTPALVGSNAIAADEEVARLALRADGQVRDAVACHLDSAIRHLLAACAWV